MTSPSGTDLTREQADALVRSRGFTVLLAVAAVIGVLVSLVAWCFLEAVHWVQEEAYVHLPHAFGYADGPPTWWPLPVLALTGVLVAAAITLRRYTHTLQSEPERARDLLRLPDRAHDGRADG